MIRGYHEYKLIWNNPVAGEDLLLCEREIGNPHDTHTVAVKKVILWGTFHEEYLQFAPYF